MKKMMRKEEGLLSIEACISLTLFIFLMLFFYGFFVVFEVRNAMSHAVLSTANSMATDQPVIRDVLNADSIVEPIFNVVYAIAGYDMSTGFSTKDTWYSDNTKVAAEAERRFKAYFAGGDDDKYEKILKKYHVVNGSAGLDFSKSKISGGKLYIVLDYEIEFEYKVFDQISLSLEHSACSKMWE